MGTINVTYKRPWLYAKQEQALFTSKRYSLVEATTKAGKTLGCIVWMMEIALLGGPHRNYWWVAPVYPQAKIAYRRMVRYLSTLPKGTWSANKQELTIEFFGAGTIWFKSAEKPDNLYGEDVYGAVFDEASRGREESWHAVRSTLTATKGPIRIIGNVRGRKNWAYKLGRKALAGAPNMLYTKITWKDAVEAGILDAQEIEDARAVLPDAVFAELYEAEPSDGAGNPFGFDAITACVSDLSSEPVVAWGWDLAKSQDWTVGVGFDRRGSTAELHRYQKSWVDTENHIRETVGNLPAVIDSTGVGAPVVERLQATNNNVVGYVFSAPSKQRLMGELKTAISGQEITYPEGVIKDELDEFEYQHTRTGTKYAAPEGLHDDAVCALALATHCRNHYQLGDWHVG